MELLVMECSLIILLFYEFSCIINIHSCLKSPILTKLSQTVCLINVTDVTVSYGRLSDLNAVVWEFLNILLHFFYIFIKLSQIVCQITSQDSKLDLWFE